MKPVIPDLSTYEVGGLMLLFAAWLVLLALKRQNPRLGRWMPWVVVGLATALVGTYMWIPAAFALLGGTIVTAALILGSHAAIKGLGKEPPDKPI